MNEAPFHKQQSINDHTPSRAGHYSRFRCWTGLATSPSRTPRFRPHDLHSIRISRWVHYVHSRHSASDLPVSPTGGPLVTFALHVRATAIALHVHRSSDKPRAGCRSCHDNDPAAGSPTATLLRLLLPLAAEHHPISAWSRGSDRPEPAPTPDPHGPPDGSIQPPSVATTGGVYKWQGHNRCRLMTDAY